MTFLPDVDSPGEDVVATVPEESVTVCPEVTCSVVGKSLDVDIPAVVTSTTVAEAVTVDSAVMLSVAADKAADIVGCALVVSADTDVSLTDVGSDVVEPVAADEPPDIVDSTVLSSTDADAEADFVVDMVTSGDAVLLPVETWDSGEVTPSVDMSVVVDSLIVVAVTSRVDADVVSSTVVPDPVPVLISPIVDKEAPDVWEVTAVPGNPMTNCSIDFSLPLITNSWVQIIPSKLIVHQLNVKI